MRTTQQYSITLPLEMAEAIERKVESGAYASVSEVIRDGVRALMARDKDFEHWLREEAAKSYDEYMADPSSGIPAKKVFDRLEAKYQARKMRER